jgi:hypothetical protein
MKITLVKKIKIDGTPCAKCGDIETRLERDGLRSIIARVVLADERKPSSEGMRLAEELGVDRAPFFILENDAGATEVFDVYLRLKQRVARDVGKPQAEDFADLVDQHPDLALI